MKVMAAQEDQQNSRPGKRGIREGLWLKCPKCKATVFRKQVDKLLGICPECDHHFYVSAMTRIEQLLDEGSFEEWFANLNSCDPLQFNDSKPYSQRLVSEQKNRIERCGCGRAWLSARSPVGDCSDRLFVHHGEYGVCGRRDSDPGCGKCD